jgi:hypothetical protein
MALPGSAGNQSNVAMYLEDAAKNFKDAAKDIEDAQLMYEDARMSYDTDAREIFRVGGSVAGVEEESDESPAELYMENLRAAEEERFSAYLGQRAAQLPRLQTVTMALPGTDSMDLVYNARYLEDTAMDLEDAKMHFEDAAKHYEDAAMDFDDGTRDFLRVDSAGVAGVEEQGESPVELLAQYIEDLSAADKLMGSACLGRWTDGFAAVAQAITNLAASANQAPPRQMNAIVADILSTQNNINHALAALLKTDRGFTIIDGIITTDEEAHALFESKHDYLKLEKHFLSHFQAERNGAVARIEGSAHQFGNAVATRAPG